MFLKKEIAARLIEFENICKVHHVKSLYGFGSSTTANFNPECSDIDLLVEVDESDPVERGEKLISFWDSLESFFKRKVDLLTPGSLRNPYLAKEIESTKVLIYDRQKAEIFV